MGPILPLTTDGAPYSLCFKKKDGKSQEVLNLDG